MLFVFFPCLLLEPDQLLVRVLTPLFVVLFRVSLLATGCGTLGMGTRAWFWLCAEVKSVILLFGFSENSRKKYSGLLGGSWSWKTGNIFLKFGWVILDLKKVSKPPW